MATNNPQAEMTNERRVAFIGSCQFIEETSRIFRMFGWQVVNVQHPPASTVKGYSSQHSGEGSLEAPADEIVVVACKSAWKGSSRSNSLVILVSGCSFDGNGAEPAELCSELLAYMRSGLGMMTRARTAEGLTGSPYLPGGHLAAFFVGLHAALLAEALTVSPLTDDAVVEVSAQECLLSTLHNALGFAQLQGRDVARDPDPAHAGGRFACLDGEVLISLPDAHHWQTLLEILGNPVWSEGGWWRDATLRFANKELLNEAIASWCVTRTRVEILTTLQESGIPAAFLSAPEDVEQIPQLQARNYHVGPPHKLVWPTSLTTMGSVASPKLASIIEPLKGVRICDFSWAWSGPYLTMCLAQLGAEVIKIESHKRIDIHRQQPPVVPGSSPDYERAAGHLLTNRGKLSFEADLKAAEDVRRVEDLVRNSDILVANFTPGVLDKLGFGFDRVTELVGHRPFVYVTLTGFGSSGPWARYRSYGSHLAELSALPSITGAPGLGPINIAIPFADTLGGVYGAAACLHLLNESYRVGRPVMLDISQFEVLVEALRAGLDYREQLGNRRPGDGPSTGVFRCAGPDNWVAVATSNRNQEEALRSLVGVGRTATQSDVLTALEEWTASRTPADAESRLLEAGIPASAVLSAAELLHDTRLQSRNFWEAYQIPEGRLLGPAAPWLINGHRPPQLSLAPQIGQHTGAIEQALAQIRTILH